MEDATNPEAPEVEDVIVDEDEIDSPELDETDTLDEDEPEPEDDSEEIEHEGQKFRIPKALKDGFLMQSDYTRKTQALSTERQAFESERTAFRQMGQAEIDAYADVVAIDKTLEQYKQIDWRTWYDQDPAAAQAARFEFDDLKDRRQSAAQTYGTAQQQRQVQEQQETAKRTQQGQERLARDIPGWNQEKALVLLDFGLKTYGFSRAELDAIDDPRVVLALHDAMEHRKSKQTAATVKKVEQQQAVRPAAKVKGATPAFKGLDDRMSADAWLAARNKQVANRK